MQFKSKDNLIDFRVHLDFANERLNFEWSSDFAQRDDGSPESAEAIAECSRFFKEYWSNGQLRVINAVSGELISRKNAFLPVNAFLNVDACDADIARWKQTALDRRESSAKSGSSLKSYAQGYGVKINASAPAVPLSFEEGCWANRKRRLASAIRKGTALTTLQDPVLPASDPLKWLR